MLRISFLLFLSIQPILGCDADACKFGSAAGIGAGCAAVGATVSALTCAVTFGVGCVVGAAVTGGVCSAVTLGAMQGKGYTMHHY